MNMLCQRYGLPFTVCRIPHPKTMCPDRGSVLFLTMVERRGLWDGIRPAPRREQVKLQQITVQHLPSTSRKEMR